MEIIFINTAILLELKEKKIGLYNKCKNIFPDLDKWISGEDYPTYIQLIELSKIFKVPFRYLFLDKKPSKIIYISGAISNDPFYRYKFKKWKEILEKSYPNAEIICPIDFIKIGTKKLIEGNNKDIWADAMIKCLKVLKNCTDIFIIPENIPSNGKEIEIIFADHLGLNFISPYEI
jgi:hypothetical protein